MKAAPIARRPLSVTSTVHSFVVPFLFYTLPGPGARRALRSRREAGMPQRKSTRIAPGASLSDRLRFHAPSAEACGHAIETDCDGSAGPQTPRGPRRSGTRRDPEGPSARHRRACPAFMAASVAASARDRERHPAGPRNVVCDGVSLRCRRPARGPVSFGCLSDRPIRASHPSGMREVSGCWPIVSSGLRQAVATIPAIHIFPVD
jgi:hypothetical protein